MKSLILITVCVYYMQTCFAEPKGLTDHEWEITRSKLKNSPGMETETFEKLVEILNKYRNDPVNYLSSPCAISVYIDFVFTGWAIDISDARRYLY